MRTLPSTLAGLALAAAACSPAPSPSAAFRPVRKAEATTFPDARVIAEFEAGADEVYRLGAGDQLRLSVWGRPELSGDKTLGPDGRITLPLAGSVALTDESREEAADTVATALGRYYDAPAVTVEVTRYAANRIIVLGRVERAGAIDFDRPPTLLEALARAGSLPVLDKKATLTRCAIFRGRDRILWVDLKRLLGSGELSLDLRLRRGDLVYIPDSDDTLVYVLGEVLHPGAYRLTPDMSLLDALSQAGGPTKDGAPSKMRLVRPRSHEERDVPFESLLDPNASANVALEEGDVIWVPRRGLAKLGYVMQQVSPLASLFVVGKAVAP